jgi:hypothetical protein
MACNEMVMNRTKLCDTTVTGKKVLFEKLLVNSKLNTFFCSFLCLPKETNQRKGTKTKLPPALPEYNVQGKRVGNKRRHMNLPEGLLPKRKRFYSCP